jgi:hypothetical protein
LEYPLLKRFKNAKARYQSEADYSTNKKSIKLITFTAQTQRTQRQKCLSVGRYRQTKRTLFQKFKNLAEGRESLWRIGISRFSINHIPLCDLRVSNESSLDDEWAVKKGFEKGIRNE